MKNCLYLFVVLFLYSCNQTKEVPERMLKKQWIFQDLAAVETETFGFMYGDIITVNGDSLVRRRSYRDEEVQQFAVIERADSLGHTLKFRQPDTTQLIVEEYIGAEKVEEYIFQEFEPGLSGTAMLQLLTENTYRFEFDTMTYDLRLSGTTDPANGVLRFTADREELVPLVNHSTREEDRNSGLRVRVVANSYFPTYLFMFFSLNDFMEVPEIMLLGVYPEGGIDILLPAAEPEKGFQIVTANEVPNDRTDHLSGDELLYLLSQGELTIDQRADFQEDTYIRYGYEEDFWRTGLSLEQLGEVGFAFNRDGSYDVFHKDRSLASGQYRISNDRGYLILEKGKYSQQIPLYSEGPDHLAFHYKFSVATPRSMGERLFSSYELEAVVNFREPR